MVQKRQLAEEEYEVSPKHLKLERSCELVPSLQFTKEDAFIHSDKDDGCIFKPILGVDYGFVSNNFTDLPLCTTKDFVDYTLPGRLSTSSWTSTTTSEEDISSKTPRMLMQPENTYSYLLEHPPLKQVPIGPEYQAHIPQTPQPNTIDENKFMGSCIIPMPEEDQTLQDNNNIGRGRSDCLCESLDCVQNHINEARETLKESIGHERFTGLGFCNMGEYVAEKWSEEDERFFHEVVYSNPVSFGRNFWNHLAELFPLLTNQEIVSYYFNVFMLRKRAEQNRCDPLNADSDDDEWQGSDDNRSEETETERGNEFIFETPDSRVWDVGYFSCQKIKTDFLPTGSMIESWDFDDNRSSN